jgi:adenine-specific DNA-methyltransferase
MDDTRIARVEARRKAAQQRLDAERTATERNKLGQFSTPLALSIEIAAYARTLLEPDISIRFSDPAIGSGSFYSALLSVFPQRRIASATGIDIDPRFAAVARDLWRPHGLHVVTGDGTDLTTLASLPRPNLILTNPPYVRHHHLGREQKVRLQAAVQRAVALRVHGLAGLYVYFMVLGAAWMEDGGLGAWLVPSEFMDVNYGDVLRRYLTEYVTLLRVHRYDPHEVQFDDALTTSAVVVFRKQPPTPDDCAHLTFGGTLAAPDHQQKVPLRELRHARKWTAFPAGSDGASARKEPARAGTLRLRDLFRIQRGLATGANEFFILPRREAQARGLADRFLRPILPSPRALRQTVIAGGPDGYPLLDEPLVLLDCELPEAEIRAAYPALWAYLETADEEIRGRYLVRKRTPWYRQERRPPAPFLCTYMGRGAGGDRPVRFLWNRSNATAANVYLMLYPTGELANLLAEDRGLEATVHELLQGITSFDLRGQGRVYGGGLHKVEPEELGRIPADAFLERIPRLSTSFSAQLLAGAPSE